MRSNSGKSEWISAFTLTKPKYQKINHLNGITASLTVSVSQTQKKNTQKKRSIPRFKFTALLLSKAGGSLELNSPSWELRGWESTHIPTTPNYPKQHSLYNQHNRAQLSSLGFFVVQKRKKSEASHYSNTHSAKHSILDTVLRPKFLALQLDLWFAKARSSTLRLHGGASRIRCFFSLENTRCFRQILQYPPQKQHQKGY